MFASKSDEVNVIGTVIKEDNENNFLEKYIIDVDSINNNNKYKHVKLIVKLKKDKTNYNITYGNKIQIYGKLQIVDGIRNYKGYNYNEYLRSKGIYGIIIANFKDVSIIEKDNVNLLKQVLWKIKTSIKENIYKILPQNTANICIAIILGDKSNLEDQTIKQFSDSSLSHILAISGMHIMYIIMITSSIFKILGKNTKNRLLIIVIILFGNLVENSESIIRATIMTVLYLSASLLHRKSDSLTNISISALIILILNPYSIKSLSFLLSFGGTIGIILFSKYITDWLDIIIKSNNKIVNYIKNSFVLTISANIIILPIIAIYFNTISLIFIITSILSNLLIICIMPLILISILFSFISIKIAKIISIILNVFLNMLLIIAQVFSNNNKLSLIIVTPYTITVIMYYFIILFILIIGRIEKSKKVLIRKISKLIIYIYVTIILSINLSTIFNSNMYIHFVDVGQGDCTLIISKNNKKILVDGGGNERGDNYIGENIVVPYLLDRRIKVIDYILISHFDSDHYRFYSSNIKKIKSKKYNNRKAI